MHTIALFGAGKIGEAITALLSLSGRYNISVCDIDLDRAKNIASVWPNSSPHKLEIQNPASLAALLKGKQAVISALPYYCNPQVAELALKNGAHYFDLTEDVETTKKVIDLAKGAATCLMPQCGLAPGFVSIAAAFLIKSFAKIDTVKMRVGALPLYPSNYIKYNLTWSTEGLINEYGNMCEVIDAGKKRTAFPLEGYERFSLDGDEYEAFNTSGGLGTLCDTLEGKVRKLDYKSVRYPGHCDFMAFLMNELRFNEDRDTLKTVFERSIPTTAQDKCLILVEAQGNIGKRLVQKTYASTVYNRTMGKHHFGAIQVTTAAGICAPMDMLLSGKLADRSGLIKSEEVPLLDFLDNEFGKIYRDEKALAGIAV
ncbi:MAG: saccharopine dehydrogenase [Proteobacteria bacterium]|nr:MAG: saccharopine dehydrogenase [Pseudomonadota bacterium]